MACVRDSLQNGCQTLDCTCLARTYVFDPQIACGTPTRSPWQAMKHVFPAPSTSHNAESVGSKLAKGEKIAAEPGLLPNGSLDMSPQTRKLILRMTTGLPLEFWPGANTRLQEVADNQSVHLIHKLRPLLPYLLLFGSRLRSVTLPNWHPRPRPLFPQKELRPHHVQLLFPL